LVDDDAISDAMLSVFVCLTPRRACHSSRVRHNQLTAHEGAPKDAHD
jgi:hypothetical protein